MSFELKITRRNLPHWSMSEAVYFVTFRVMEGSLSSDELNIVFDHILSGNCCFYLLISLVLMPDHGHIIFKSFPHYFLQRVMKGIKGVSSHLVNQSRGTGGTVWQDESYDRIVRNDGELLLGASNKLIKRTCFDFKRQPQNLLI